MSEKSGCGVSFGTVRISDLDCGRRRDVRGDKVLAEARESLRTEAEPLGLRTPWIKSEVQAFADILNAIIESIPVSVQNI